MFYKEKPTKEINFSQRRWTFYLSGGGILLVSIFFFLLIRSSQTDRSYFPIFGRENLTSSIRTEAEKPKGKNDLGTEITDLSSLPSSVKLPVPFVSQAPFEKWDELHEEACEEAAIITGHYYLWGEKKISKEKAEEEIQKMVAFQKEHSGSHRDLNAQEMIDLAHLFYGRNFILKKDYTLTTIKQFLAQGIIVIVPAGGRILENPYFKQPGPLYHVLVIIGYDEKKEEFITNDPGTKRGAGFRYAYTNLLESIHDFPGTKEQILTGEKVIILVQ